MSRKQELAMQTKRLDYLDFIKAVAICMVVFCHRVVIPDDSVAGAVCMVLVFSAVPCFMMCSGYVLLFKQESAGKSFRRAGHVYLCMVVWKALYFFFFQMFDTVEWNAVTLFRYLFLFCSLPGVDTENLWFLQAYIPALLATPLLAPMFTQRKFGMALAYTGLAYLSNQFVMSANLLLQVGSSRLHVELFDVEMLSHVFPLGGEYSSMLVCFLLGGVYRLLEERNLPQKRSFRIAAFFGMTLGLAIMMGVRYLQMGSFAWKSIPLVAKYEWSGTLLTSFCVFALLRPMGDGKLARWLGRNVGQCSMGVYYLHYLCLIPLSIYVYPLLPVSLWVNFAKTALVVAFCVLLTKAGKRIPLVRELMR